MYKSLDREFSMTFMLSGANYLAENKRIYDELKSLVIGGPDWTLVFRTI